MKLNKWTLGLMAAGLVSLTVNAEEKAVTTPLLTALSSTTISGYVDTSAEWNPGSGNANPAPFSFNAGKQDGFNLDSVLLSIAKPLEEGQWSAGYNLDLMFGPDSVPTTGDVAVRQAFVTLRAPVGNGLDVSIGRWDAIIGYEASDSYKNPNFTRSYAYTITPTEHDGVLAAYRFNDMISAKFGVANTANTGGINARNGNGFGGTATESQKAYMASIGLTAPDSTGFLKGSTLNLGVVHGPTAGAAIAGVRPQTTDLSISGSIMTPLEGLRLGAAFDEIFDASSATVAGAKLPHTYVAGAYVSFKPAPDSKLSLHARGEYYHGAAALLAATPAQLAAAPSGKEHIWSATGTIQYDLWQNVLSRLEVRWDHADSGRAFGGKGFAAAPTKKNDVIVAANVVYKF